MVVFELSSGTFITADEIAYIEPGLAGGSTVGIRGCAKEFGDARAPLVIVEVLYEALRELDETRRKHGGPVGIPQRSSVFDGYDKNPRQRAALDRMIQAVFSDEIEINNLAEDLFGGGDGEDGSCDGEAP